MVEKIVDLNLVQKNKIIKMNFEYFIQSKNYNKTFCLLQKNLIGKLIKKGKKNYALKLYSDIKYFLKKKTKKEPKLLILIAILNTLIKCTFIKVRFGAVKKEIPVPIKFERQIRFAITALLNYVKTKRMKSINVKKLVNLICFCYKFKGPLIKRNFNLYKKAIANRVLLNFIKK